MSITPFLGGDGSAFDSETKRVMGVAFEMAESSRYHVIAAYENPAEHSSSSRAGSLEPSVECRKLLFMREKQSELRRV
jgi:hypothetical protein